MSASKPDFTVKQGNLQPSIEATLTQAGEPIPLDGATVSFVFRHEVTGLLITREARVTNAAGSKVLYEPIVGDRDLPGAWIGEWKISASGEADMIVPDVIDNPQIRWEVIPALVAIEAGMPIAALYEPLRHLLQDDVPECPRQYEDAALLSAVRTMIVMGKLKGYTLSPDRLAIRPLIENPNHLALLLYRTVHSFIASKPSRESVRSRAFSTSVGSYHRFLAHIEESIGEIECGHMFTAWQSLDAWCMGTTGLDLGAVYSALHVDAPFRSWTFSQGGVSGG